MIAGSSSSGVGDEKTELNRGDLYLGGDYWVVKINSLGQKVWDKTLGGSQDERTSSILATPNGEFIIVGASESDISGDKTEDRRG